MHIQGSEVAWCLRQGKLDFVLHVLQVWHRYGIFLPVVCLLPKLETIFSNSEAWRLTHRMEKTNRSPRTFYDRPWHLQLSQKYHCTAAEVSVPEIAVVPGHAVTSLTCTTRLVGNLSIGLYSRWIENMLVTNFLPKTDLNRITLQTEQYFHLDKNQEEC